MAEVLPMKIYTTWREDEKPEIRRCEVDMRNKLKFVHVSEILYGLYPKLQHKVFSVYWKDSEGDDILISSDHELDIAVAEMGRSQLLKLYVHCKDDQPKDEVLNITVTAAADTACGSGAQQGTVICDGCEDHITGFRYKCIVCDDYDLCGRCELAGVHAKHCMIRVSMPDMQKENIRAAIKNLRTILKALHTEAYRRARENRDKSCERRHRASADYHRRHGERGHRKQRGSWFDTFTTYMNEFANLAGDVQTDPEPKKEENNETPAAETASPKPETEQATPQRNPDVVKEIDAMREYMKKMFQLRAERGADFAELFKGLNIESETTAEETDNREAKEKSTERADGWTVIDSENDGAMPAEISRPAGSDTSDEGRPRYVQSIYPPLNVSTAEPKERIIPVEISEPGPSNVGKEMPKPSAPKAPEPAKPEPKPEPTRQPHPVPEVEASLQHIAKGFNNLVPQIEAAIQQMMSMGFTNEGGWLTQLLESKQGDIAAVLDLLTPANTKK
ncbi:sequestosome-1-like isoform X2 [Aricia agestis]|uniref:sequestosome-1-like isoform X2 n=1 Tax=Aricia agestis TaxID=91739 RepID=UPI001C20457A|nr:sequestosome-1-like isoform X2 [Aricia agestis]